MTRALVTGAAQGIGAAIAERLDADFDEVVRVDLRPGDGTIEADVADRRRVMAVAAEVGPVDLLVNNAGIWRFAPIEAATEDDVTAVVGTNLLGTLWCAQAFGAPMLERGRGAIVNIASIAAVQAGPAIGIYAATKAAIVSLTRQLAIEWGPRGVRTNAVGPGLVPTPGAGDVYDDPAVRAARSAAVPIGRLARPADIAEAVAYLGTDRAAYVNGQVLYVDGGLTQALLTLVPRPAATSGPALATGARDPMSVVRRHLAMVETGDQTGMSADYALDAVLARGTDRHEGRDAIAGYFATVPDRLGEGIVRFEPPELLADEEVAVRWRLDGGPGSGTSGRDTFRVHAGWIVAQTVALDGDDF